LTGTIRIGTRGSALALAQSAWVRTRLQQEWPGLEVTLVTIKTSGDRFVDRPLSSVGGKGLFVKEIEAALCAGEIECAVHSMKDVPSDLAEGLIIAAVPAREDPRDVLVARPPARLGSLPTGARIGTSSLRRAALIRHQRPELLIEPLRGNVDSRLRRIERGELDAVVLAAAGLRRLGIIVPGAEPFGVHELLPAIGQGALAIECRANAEARAVVAVLDDEPTRAAVTAERGFMAGVGGSCHTPLAAHAILSGTHLDLQALIASPDGQEVLRGQRRGTAADAERLGRDLAAELLDLGGARILAALASGPERLEQSNGG
jgi:hydroxymethylbilane synthase